MTVNTEQMIEHEILGKLWGMCDRARGSLSRSVYAYHILILLWIKYTSDKKREEGECETEGIYYFKEIDFEEIYRERESKYIGHMMNEYTRRIFEEVDFGNIYVFGKEGMLLKEMIEGIRELDLRPSRLGSNQVLSRVCKNVIERVVKNEGKGAGMEWVPIQVAKLMAQILEVKKEECVYDPYCGMGELLLEVNNYVQGSRGHLYGETTQGMMKDLAKINFMFEQEMNYTIVKKDSLMARAEDNAQLYNQFDVSMSAIPFVNRNWRNELMHSAKVYEQLITMGIEYTYIAHMLRALKEEGRMAVIVNHGVLFRLGREQRIRKELVEHNLLDAVIGLPSKLFSRSSMAVCLLIFKKDRAYKDVIFIDASAEEYYIKDRLVNTLTESGLKSIIDSYKTRETVTNCSYVATYKQLHENEFNLNIESYIVYEQEEEKIGLHELKQRIQDCEERREAVHKRFEDCVEKLLK